MQNAHYDHWDSSAEITRLTIEERCRKRAAEEELPRRLIFDDVCRTAGAASSQVSFDAEQQVPTLPNNPQTGDGAFSSSRVAFRGDSSFYRGQVTAGSDDTALVFASDAQLDLLRQSHVLMHIDSTFGVVPRRR